MLCADFRKTRIHSIDATLNELTLPDTAPAPLSTLLPTSDLSEAQGSARVSDGAAFDVCHGALALRALLAVNSVVLLATYGY